MDNVTESTTSKESGPPVFNGGDLVAYIDNIRIGNLERIEWSIRTNTVHIWEDGDGYRFTGEEERSCAAQQVRPARLVESRRRRRITGSLVMTQYDTHALLGYFQSIWGAMMEELKQREAILSVFDGEGARLRDKISEIVVSPRYADELPPFDLTLIATAIDGRASCAALFGVKITSESTGFSMNDIGSSAGFEFIAKGVKPWAPVETESNRTIPDLSNND